ncbi:hypothetical protein RB195_010945 [Necator americanus]
MSDIMRLYLKRFSSNLQYYMDQRGQTSPSLADVKKTFNYMKVNYYELYEYLRQVRSIEAMPSAPVFPNTSASRSHLSRIEFPRQESPADVDEKSSQVKEETILMKHFPLFSEASAYSVGFVKPLVPAASPQENLETEVKSISSPLSPPPKQHKDYREKKLRKPFDIVQEGFPKSGTEHVSSHNAENNCLDKQIISKDVGETENDLDEREDFRVHDVNEGRKKVCGDNHLHVVRDSLENLQKKRPRYEITSDALRRHSTGKISAKQSSKIVDLLKKLEKQRKIFKNVLEKTNAVLRECQLEASGNPDIVEVKLNEKRKVSPLRLRIIRNPTGSIDYQIIKPQFIIRFKKTLLLKCKAFLNHCVEKQKSGDILEEDQNYDSMATCDRGRSSKYSLRKQEPTRSRKVAVLPYLASDLLRNSYAVLTACMTGRAFPNLGSTQEGEETRNPNTTPQDEISKQRVNEVIWQQLFGQSGIFRRERRKL